MQVQHRGLKSYHDNPNNVCSLARHMFNSKKMRTIVVEGNSDKRFFEQWLSGCRFHACNGKRSVIDVYKFYINSHKNDLKFMYFVVDLDFDEILGRALIKDESFIYNHFCSSSCYNDMEVFLVNTPAFEKVLSNFDLDAEKAGCIRQKLREASAVLGSFRAADFWVQKKNRLGSSVLKGLEVGHFFDEKQILVDSASVDDAVRRSSGYNGLYSADLIDKARELRGCYRNSWKLSRGHDVTEMLSLFLKETQKNRSNIGDLEMMLRLACEKSHFKDSPVGKRFLDMGLLK